MGTTLIFFDYIDTGSTPSKKFQAENETTDYFILKASSLSNKGLIWGKVENITENYFSKKEGNKIKQNDILVLCSAHSPEQIGKKISVINQIDNDKGNTITVGELITLRIENNDKTRCLEKYEKALVDDLTWLGLSWKNPVRRQSEYTQDYLNLFRRSSL